MSRNYVSKKQIQRGYSSSTPGVYEIVITDLDGKEWIYIGSTSRLNQRRLNHLSNLRANISSCKKMQAIWNSHVEVGGDPEDHFCFNVLFKDISKAHRLTIESELIDRLMPCGRVLNQLKNRGYCFDKFSGCWKVSVIDSATGKLKNISNFKDEEDAKACAREALRQQGRRI